MIWGNLAVSNLERTTAFYTALGFKANGTPNKMLTSFLFGEHDFVIHFFEYGSQIDEYLPGRFENSEVIFTLSAETEAEVKEWEAKVKEAGGHVFNEADRDKTNHYGFAFADPDGHKFNILLIEKGM